MEHGKVVKNTYFLFLSVKNNFLYFYGKSIFKDKKGYYIIKYDIKKKL
jgi:hypothetical protein